MRNRHGRLGRLATDTGHMQMEPTNMSDKHSDANSLMSGRVHGPDHAAANERMPRSVWQPGVVRRLADYIKHVREVDQQPNECAVADQPDQSSHVCTRNPHRTCNCPAGACADDDATYRYARGPYRHAQFTQHAADIYSCPISGRICLGYECRDWCESGVDRTKT